MPYSRREGIINGGMTERALYTDGFERAVMIEKSRQPYNRVQLQESQGYGGIVQVHLPTLDLLDQSSRKSILVHFESDGQCSCRRDARAYSTMLGAFNSAMELQRTAPKILITKRIMTENVSALLHEVLGGTVCPSFRTGTPLFLLRTEGKNANQDQSGY